MSVLYNCLFLLKYDSVLVEEGCTFLCPKVRNQIVTKVRSEDQRLPSAHHLAAEGIEENMIEPFHYFYTVVCLANGQLSRLLARFAVTSMATRKLWLRLSTSSVISQSSRMTIGRTLRLCGATAGNGDRIGMRNDDRAAYA